MSDVARSAFRRQVRERLGRLVAETWAGWAREQADPDPSWLLPWEALGSGRREAAMRVGQAVADTLSRPRWHVLLPPDPDELAAIRTERDRYLDALAWYAFAPGATVAADGGLRAYEALRDAGKLEIARQKEGREGPGDAGAH